MFQSISSFTFIIIIITVNRQRIILGISTNLACNHFPFPLFSNGYNQAASGFADTLQVYKQLT